MGHLTARRRVLRLDERGPVTRPDSLAVEEPLEIRVGGRPLTVTMRTPGHDIDLVAGFLLTEGLVAHSADLRSMRRCMRAAGEAALDVDLAHDHGSDTAGVRTFLTTSACGVCGKPSADAVRMTSRWAVRDDPLCLSRATLMALPTTLLDAQRVFARTGGLHAAGLFDRAGRLLCVREDVGRHNAVDKVVGWAVRTGRIPLRGCVLQVSGRASFELVQKGLMAGVPLIAAVSAPSSLAVDLAEESGMTLVGFVRGTSMNVYTGAHRVSYDGASPTA